MIYCALYDPNTFDVVSLMTANGDIASFGNEDYHAIQLTEEQYTEATTKKNGCYVKNGKFYVKPKQPTKWHKWDMASEEWVLDNEFMILDESNRVRDERDLLLKQMDEVVSNPLRWASFSPELQAQWSQYRLDLLNVPQQAGFPLNVVFPEKPSL